MLSLKHMTLRKRLSSYGHWVASGGVFLVTQYTDPLCALSLATYNTVIDEVIAVLVYGQRPTEPLLDRYSLCLSRHMPSLRVHIKASDRFMLLFKDY